MSTWQWFLVGLRAFPFLHLMTLEFTALDSSFSRCLQVASKSLASRPCAMTDISSVLRCHGNLCMLSWAKLEWDTQFIGV